MWLWGEKLRLKCKYAAAAAAKMAQMNGQRVAQPENEEQENSSISGVQDSEKTDEKESV